jgi:hypothetical protein
LGGHDLKRLFGTQGSANEVCLKYLSHIVVTVIQKAFVTVTNSRIVYPQIHFTVKYVTRDICNAFLYHQQVVMMLHILRVPANHHYTITLVQEAPT